MKNERSGELRTSGTRTTKQFPIALGLLIWLAVSAGAHRGDFAYPIPELTDEMLAEIRLDDGQIEEWIELLGEPTMTLQDFAEGYANSSLDPSDLDFRVWLAWHDDPARFYVAFVASDDLYMNTHDYDEFSLDLNHFMGSHDSIVLTIDGDHSGGAGISGSSSEETLLKSYGQTQKYFAIARTASGPTLDNDLRSEAGGFSWKVFPPYGDGGGGVFGEAPTISVIEFYVTPFDHWGEWESVEESVVSDLAAGQVIGFAIAVHDWDENEEGWDSSWTPRAMLPSSDPLFDIWDLEADFFLDGLLLSAYPAEPGEETAVESVSWGRIKASLELE